MCGIYKIENLINNKKYIGKSINIEKRFKSHIQESFNKNKKSYNHLIHQAIRKYGVENFSFITIEECDDEKLNEREIYWISYYDCCILDGGDKGYNMTRGGDGSSFIDAKKIQELWDKGFSVKEIAEQLYCDRHSISKRLQSYKNYTFEENKRRQYSLVSKSRQKEVFQYDLNGKFIAKYQSVIEASKKTGIGYRTILSNLQGKSYSAGKYRWTYKELSFLDQYNLKGNGYAVPIIQLDLQYNFVNEFLTITEAANSVSANQSSISYALNDINRTVKGYHWIRKNEYEADLAAH